jgi:mannose-1-phosphate guanylyltransferase
LQAIILVGGKGTRLRPLTYETPKQMLPLVGVPMIECVLESLARHGVTDAVLSLGYLPDRFTEAYPSNLIKGVRVTYAVEAEPLDTAGAIRFAATSANVDETFLVVNGDVVTDLDVTALLNFHREHDAHRAASGRGPLTLWRRADQRGRSSPRLRGETAARRGADQPDQCRYLRL